MRSAMNKTTVREIKGSLGRYLAILAIIGLGVGFFSGLRVCKPAMVNTADDYVTENRLFDFRMVSTLGYTDENIENVRADGNVKYADGAVFADVLMNDGENDRVFKVHSLTENVNLLRITDGRLPQNDRECVGDARYFSPDMIGSTLCTADYDEDSILRYDSYTVVGLAYSPYYINFERGSTSLGKGTVDGFIYMNYGGFNVDYYSEIFVYSDIDGEIYSDEYNDKIDSLTDRMTTLAEEQATVRYDGIVADAESEINEAQQEYDDGVAEYEKQKKNAENELDSAWKKIKSAQSEISSNEKKLSEAEKLIEEGQSELDERQAALDAAIAAGIYDEEQAAYAQGQIDAAQAQLDGQKEELAAGKKKLTAAKSELSSAKKKYYSAKDEAENELEKAKAELDDAAEKIADAKADVAEIERPEVYLLDRNTNVGYVCYESDSQIVEGISTVFPVFFFLVAALVCSTTMTRMVDEQRTQIGVMKALGYGKAAIMKKYVVYSGSAAVIGCLIGFFVGTYAIPKVIWMTYDIMYGFGDINYVFSPVLLGVSFAVSVLCSVGATCLSCRSEFANVPAQLMRPKPPKSGTRILLDRITFIWSRLKFLHKVSLRNVVRYKKRIFMMLLGISGCTALIVTGFGIRDSISDVAADQYGEITVYDYSVSFDEPVDADFERDFVSLLGDEIDGCLFLHESTVDTLSESGEIKSTHFVAVPSGSVDGFIDLHSGSEPVAYPSLNEAVINRKLADDFGVDIGGRITVRDSDMKEMTLTVSGIFDNYVYNYIYVSEETCSEQWGYSPEICSAYINVSDGTDVHSSAAAVADTDNVSSVSVNSDIEERVSNMLSSLDYIVLMVIVCAGALAFIVLYNLTNINITERVREIATLRVLGFYRGETAQYVFRENIILTVLCLPVGLLLGKLLHAFVMSQIKIDMMYFDVKVSALSYIIAAVMTLLFTVCVNLLMSIKLGRISMAESLKSVE